MAKAVFLAALVVATGLEPSALAQPQEPAIEHVRFDRVITGSGQPMPVVHAAAQSPDGFLWLATDAGLDRYDGYQLRPGYRTGGAVRIVYRGRDDALWLGADAAGLVRFDPISGSMTSYSHRESNPREHHPIRALAEDHRGDVWIGTAGGGLHRLDRDTGAMIRPKLGDAAPAARHILAIAVALDGTVWLGTDGNGLLAVRQGQVIAAYRHDPDRLASLGGDTVTALLQDGSGRLWVGTERGGAAQLMPDGSFEHVAGLGGAAIRALHADSLGNLWIASNRGLYWRHAGSGAVRSYSRNALDSSSLSDNDIQWIHEDASGLLWLGTKRGGIDRHDLTRRGFGHYRHQPFDPHSLSTNSVWSVYKDPGGILWVGTDGAGLNRLDPGAMGFVHYRHDSDDPRSLIDDHVTAIRRGPDGALWVGAESGGVSRLDADGRFTRFTHDPSDPTSLGYGTVSAIYVDSRGDLWLVASGGQLNRRTRAGNEFERIDVCSGIVARISDCYMTGVIEDERGTLWIAVYTGGLIALAPDLRTRTLYRHDPLDPMSLHDDAIVATALGHDDSLWLGTTQGSLSRRDPHTGQINRLAWPRERGVTSVFSIVAHQSDLWLGTDQGIWRYTPSTGEARRFSKRDGAQDELNPGAAFRDPATGELFFGGTNGLTRFQPDHITADPHPAPIAITAVRRGETEVPLTGVEVIELGHDDSVLSLELAVLDYRRPAENRYRYRLDGHNPAWIEAGRQRVVTYTNLAPGRYVFRAQGAGSSRVWSDEEARLRLRVLPPWWQTWWFRAAVMLVLSAAMVLIPFRRYRNKLARSEAARAEERGLRRRMVEARERERTRLARELHDGPIQDLHALRLSLAAQSRPVDDPGRPEALQAIADELRQLCAELRPPVATSLATAIRWHAARIRERRPGLAIELSLMDDEQALPKDLRLELFRIYQEALSNAIQHASARRVTIELEIDAEGCWLAVRDDGRGFQVEASQGARGRRDRYGLIGMRERSEIVGGRLTLRSQPGAGTEVRIEVPAESLRPETRQGESP